MKSLLTLKNRITISYPSFHRNYGFTLIEIVITMTIIVMLGGWGLFYNLNNLRYHSFASDQEMLISILQYARGKAMANTCDNPCFSGQPYGVYIENDKFIIFQGQNYSSATHENDILLTTNSNLIHSGINEIYFDQVTGNAHSNQSPPWEIILASTLNNENFTITINSEGQILWEN